MSTLNWRMNQEIYHRWGQLMKELGELESHTEAYQQIVDDIRRLQGFPCPYNEHHDEIQIDVSITNPMSILTIPKGRFS